MTSTQFDRLRAQLHQLNLDMLPADDLDGGQVLIESLIKYFFEGDPVQVVKFLRDSDPGEDGLDDFYSKEFDDMSLLVPDGFDWDDDEACDARDARIDQYVSGVRSCIQSACSFTPQTDCTRNIPVP